MRKKVIEMEENEKMVEKLVEEESLILEKVLEKFHRERISDLNEPEVKGLLAMYERVSRNYTAEKINLEKDKRTRLINNKKRAEAPRFAERTAETSGKRSESDLPIKCTLKSRDRTIGRIQDRKLLSPEGKEIDKIYPRDGRYGTYYRFDEHKNAILTKSKKGVWLLKEKKDGDYKVVGHVSKGGD